MLSKRKAALSEPSSVIRGTRDVIEGGGVVCFLRRHVSSTALSRKAVVPFDVLQPTRLLLAVLIDEC